MERLPDELFLYIFRYLHQFDLIYAFHNLNQRFQQLINVYQYNIVLTEETGFSYTQFARFVKDIVPNHSSIMQSLTINGYQQIQLFTPYLCSFTNLKSLVVGKDRITEYSYYAQRVDLFLTIALSLPCLTEVSILDNVSEMMLHPISSYASAKLTTLILISSSGFPEVQTVSPIPHIQCLSIALHSIARLKRIFEIMPNLKELKLSMIFFRNPEEIDHLNVPISLEKLHLESGNYRKFGTRPDINTVKKFLNAFKYQLRSLTLLIVNATEEFSNFEQFQSLTSELNHLKTFEYYVRTDYRPDRENFPNVRELFGYRYSFCTFPQPEFFDKMSDRTKLERSFNDDLDLKEFLDSTTLHFTPGIHLQTLRTCISQLADNIKLIHLKELSIDSPIEDLTFDESDMISRLLSLSPNLDTLIFYSNDIKKMVQNLKDLQPVLPYFNKMTHLTYLKFVADSFNSTSIHDLSKIFPNVKTIKFPSVNFVTQNTSMKYLLDTIQDMRKYFVKLIRWKLNLPSQYSMEEYQQNLDKMCRKKQDTFFSYVYEDDRSLSIWF